MGTLWFWLVAIMLAAYVVLDGFDIGIGILSPLAHSEEDRRVMLRSIGPVWDGNEVWLLAAGGTLYFAFPLLYASAFSGFYLPLMIVLWLLILRGLGIELRAHVDSTVWRSFFDGLFFASSALLAFFFGVALANVVRGVPLGADRYFFLPLWTNWRIGPQPGILDWYTVMGGALALIALTMHGSLYLALKATGLLEERANKWARHAWVGLLFLTLLGLPATIWVRPGTLANYKAHPLLFAVPLMVLFSLLGMRLWSSKGRPLAAFLSSCAYLILMLVGAAAGLYPVLLPSSADPARSITLSEALSGAHAIRVGLAWWSFGMLLALTYFAVIYWMFRGKVCSSEGGYGH
ncbi:MAG: cytochrome d ubiquinol oxidase subunit II [Bacillota bacterium]|nr:cytochrome d ubiquinol oxidase subunit II [Bacillota bacterium]